MHVTLLDYGAGNNRSVEAALVQIGLQVSVVKTAEDILSAKCLVFPGVGSFSSCKQALIDLGFFDPLRQYLSLDRPFIGICLGMQILFESSEECDSPDDPQLGLGVIPGRVERFRTTLPVPHIGWNGVRLIKRGAEVFEGLDDPHAHFYFVHSYKAVMNDENWDWVLGLTDYGSAPFVSCVSKGRLFATQFHPEKSGKPGLELLRRVVTDITKEALPVELAMRSEEEMSSIKETKLVKRIVAALDVRENDCGDLIVTKGDQYDVREKDGEGRAVRNLGKPVELAVRYSEEGADEIAFLNITSFRGEPVNDAPMLKVLELASATVRVPLCIGGGIRDYTDTGGKLTTAVEVAGAYFRSGADKISIGSDAVTAAEQFYRNGDVGDGSTSIEQISRKYGAQAVVVSIDPKRVYVNDATQVSKHTLVKTSRKGPAGEDYCWYQCSIKGGREFRDIDAFAVAKAVEKLGAGELLVNCIDEDGQGNGFDVDLMAEMRRSVAIPVVASSGAGNTAHFVELFEGSGVEAALAAGIFHRHEVALSDVKSTLIAAGIPARVV